VRLFFFVLLLVIFVICILINKVSREIEEEGKFMKNVDVVMMKIDDLIPYSENPRINDLAVGVVAESIREFGFKNPIIVDGDNVIIAGHTRHKAAKRLGLEEVPVIVADDLTPEQVKAFRIMDNKSSEYAEWDYQKLLAEIDSLEDANYDVNLTGFDEIELGNIIEELEGKQKKDDEDRPELEFTEELLEEHQYVVLYFDNTMDWQVAERLFDIKPVKALDSREGYERKGVGRVINGTKVLKMIQEGQNNF